MKELFASISHNPKPIICAGLVVLGTYIEKHVGASDCVWTAGEWLTAAGLMGLGVFLTPKAPAPAEPPPK